GAEMSGLRPGGPIALSNWLHRTSAQKVCTNALHRPWVRGRPRVRQTHDGELAQSVDRQPLRPPGPGGGATPASYTGGQESWTHVLGCSGSGVLSGRGVVVDCVGGVAGRADAPAGRSRADAWAAAARRAA